MLYYFAFKFSKEKIIKSSGCNFNGFCMMLVNIAFSNLPFLNMD